MTFLYILTTDGKDKFIDMTYLSVSFLRHIHPESKICIVCDSISATFLNNSSSPLLKIIDEIISIETPDGTNVWKSRYLKCRMRKFIKGDFLFLDSDTIAVKRLDEIFNCPYTVAAANNHSKTYSSNFIGIDQELYIQMGWTFPHKHYLNTGVLFWKDNTDANFLADLYLNRWQDSQTRGYHIDQPAFNVALADWKGEYCVLDDIYNSQFRPNILASVDASVWHFYNSDINIKLRDYFLLGLEIIRKKNTVTKEFINKVISCRLPFETKNLKREDELLKKILIKGDTLSKLDYYQSQGQYLSYILEKYNLEINGIFRNNKL